MDIGDDFQDVASDLLDRVETARLRAAHVPGQPGALDGDMTVEALPTSYRGTVFRSALEASWAATLDAHGVAWEYEPRMVDLPSGARYLPDFHLPEIGTWLEVKGTGVPRVEKAVEYAALLACDCPRLACDCRWPGGELVIVGHPPRPFSPWQDEAFNHWPHRSKARLAWRHGGFVDWTSARGRAAWMTRCPDCRAVTWFDSPRCRACRGPLAGARGASPAGRHFEFTRVRGTAVPDPEEQETA